MGVSWESVSISAHKKQREDNLLGGGSLVSKAINKAVQPVTYNDDDLAQFCAPPPSKPSPPPEKASKKSKRPPPERPIDPIAGGTWTRTAFEQREKEEVDCDVNPYTFSSQSERLNPISAPSHGQPVQKSDAVRGIADKVAFRDLDHAYFVHDKNSNDYVRVMMSASSLWEYYVKNARYPKKWGPVETYVQDIMDKVPQSLLIYLCSFYTEVTKKGLTNRLTLLQRIDLFESVMKQTEGMTDHNGKLLPWKQTEYMLPFPVVGGGVWDMFEDWLIDGTGAVHTEPVLPDNVIDPSPLYDLYLFLTNWFWQDEIGAFRDVIKQECPPLFKLMEIKRTAIKMLQTIAADDKVVDNKALASKFSAYPRDIGSAAHSYLEIRIKSKSREVAEEYADILVSSEIRGICERIVEQVFESGVIGTYVNELSEAPFVMLKYMVGAKSDIILREKSGTYAVADFKFSQPTLDEVLKLLKTYKRQVRIDPVTGVHWADLDNMTVPQSGSVWGYTFQMTTYRKGMMMNRFRPFSLTEYMIVISAAYPTGFLMVKIQADTIRTAISSNHQLFTAPEQVDQALQLRYQLLQRMQEHHLKTGSWVDERYFVENGGEDEILL